MKARYQYRFYPTNQQRQILAQLFGCVRVVWVRFVPAKMESPTAQV
ncbi:helix-turn-helix domain-containing protein [Microseira sp. BLCC-F43]